MIYDQTNRDYYSMDMYMYIYIFLVTVFRPIRTHQYGSIHQFLIFAVGGT